MKSYKQYISETSVDEGFRDFFKKKPKIDIKGWKAKIHQGKHSSDTDIYDVNGVFNQDKFNELFSKYDTDQDHALSEDELQGFFSRNFEDSTGSLASKAEFGLLLEIAGQDQVIADKQTRVLTRDTLSRFYDGTLLFDIAGETVPFQVGQINF